MARDMQVDLLVKPIVDTKKFDAELQRLQKMADRGVSGLSSKESAVFEALATRLMTSLMVSGRAKTSTQARLQIQDFLGPISGTTKSALRGAQNASDFVIKQGRVMPYETFSERQIKRWKPDLANTATAYKSMLESYAAFKAAPTQENKDALLKAVLGVSTQLANISKERKKEVKAFDKIGKTTEAIQKEALEFNNVTTPTATANAVGAAEFFRSGIRGLGRIFGISSMGALIKKWIDFGVSGIKEGSGDLLEQAMYGANRNISIGRSRAKMYDLDESVTAAPERYALDFRQRMMWGEVSDKEWIALSRMGSLGQKIVSGEAARDPQAFQKEIENYIAQNRGNEAEVRQMLSWLGWSPQLMKYGAINYTDSEKKELEDTYAEAIRKQKDAAVLVWATVNEFHEFMAKVKSTAANNLADITRTPESRQRLARSWSGAGYSSLETGGIYSDAERTISRINAIKNSSFLDRLKWTFSPEFDDYVRTRAQGGKTEAEYYMENNPPKILIELTNKSNSNAKITSDNARISTIMNSVEGAD